MYDGPPKDPGTPPPPAHSGVYVSDHGSMTFNGDGKTDNADLEKLKALIGTRPDTILAETEDLLHYDITGDGFVDARDT